MDRKKELLLDNLYSICQIRSLTSKEVMAKLIVNMQVNVPAEKQDKVLEIIRSYKQSGKNLESTLNMLYDIFYPRIESFNQGKSPWDTSD